GAALPFPWPACRRGPLCIRSSPDMTATRPARAKARKSTRSTGATGARDAAPAPILEAVRKRAGKAAQDDAVALASAFYRRLAEEGLPLHSAAGWAALATGLLEFLRRRPAGTAKVRLINPVLRTHGWESPHTVLQVVNDDMPFLVDSVTMALADRGVKVHVLGHPVIQITRDRAGRLLSVGEGETESDRKSTRLNSSHV